MKFSLSLSILLHGLGIFLFSFYVTKLVSPSEIKVRTESVFVLSDFKNQSSSHPKLRVKTPRLLATQKNSRRTFKILKVSHATKHTPHPANLLDKLHQALRAKVANSTYQELKGKVTLGFYLSPDGVISDPNIVHSSHYADLDTIATRALAAINPFPEAAYYLKKRRFFTVEIVFT